MTYSGRNKMFNDERINAESGKIYQRGILYATLVSLLYGALRGTYFILAQGRLFLPYLLTELTIVLFGLGILITGAVRFPWKDDERMVADKHRFFLGAGKLFVVAALAGYAVTIPLSRGKAFADMPVNHLILILQVLGYLYFFYTFKTRGISFNYSVIAEEKSTYYRAVFTNIGKLSGALLIAFLFAAMLDLALNRSVLGFLGVLRSGLLSAIGLGLEYWFISWIEKRSYDEEDTQRLKSGTVIAFLVLIGTFLLSSATVIAYTFIVSGDLSSLPGGNLGELLASLSYTKLYAGYLQNALTAMVLCLLLTQTGNSPRTRRAVACILGLTVFSVLYQLVVSFFPSIIMPLLERSWDPYAIQQIMVRLTQISKLASLVGIFLQLGLAHSLTKEVGVAKILLAAPALKLALFLADLFFSSQSMARTSVILNTVMGLATAILAFSVLNRHKYSPIFEESEEA